MVKLIIIILILLLIDDIRIRYKLFTKEAVRGKQLQLIGEIMADIDDEKDNFNYIKQALIELINILTLTK